MAPMQGVPPALPPGTLAPRARTAAAPAQCPAPGEGVTLRNWKTRLQGNGLGNFYYPQDSQIFGVLLFLLHEVHFHSQNDVSLQRAGKGH